MQQPKLLQIYNPHWKSRRWQKMIHWHSWARKTSCYKCKLTLPQIRWKRNISPKTVLYRCTHMTHVHRWWFFLKWIFKEQIGHMLTSFKSIVVESVSQITGIEHNSQKINNRWYSLTGCMSPAKEGDRISCKIHAWILACLGCVFVCFNCMLGHSTEQREQVPTAMKKKAIFSARFYLMHIVKLWIRILFMKTNHFLQRILLRMTQKNIFIDYTQMLLTKSAVE